MAVADREFRPRPDYNFEATPLMIGGVLYTTAGARRNVVAIDGASGETLWMWRFEEGTRAAVSPFQLGAWTGPLERPGGASPAHITPGYRLIALDARTGRPAAGFGADVVEISGKIRNQPPPKEGQIGSSSPPI